MEVDHPFTGHQVVVLPRGGDVFQMHVFDERGKLADGFRRVVLHAVEVADVEVQAEVRRVEVPGEFEVLVRRFNQQVRLGFHQQRHADLLRMFHHRFQLFHKQLEALVPGAAIQRATGLGGDARCAEFRRQAQRFLGVLGTNTAVVCIWLDPARIPVLLALVVHRVHHKRIHVAELQPVLFHRLADGLLLACKEIRGPRVWHIGHEFETGVPDAGQPAGGVREAEVQIRIGAEGEFHGWASRV